MDAWDLYVGYLCQFGISKSLNISSLWQDRFNDRHAWHLFQLLMD